MKRNLFLILFFICILPNAYSQWNLASGTGSIDLYSLDIVNSNTIYAGGANNFLTSSNGGVNWTPIQLKDSFNNIIGATELTSLEFLSQTFGFAAGPAFANNQEIVFRTYNSGANWYWVSLTTGGKIIKYSIR